LTEVRWFDNDGIPWEDTTGWYRAAQDYTLDSELVRFMGVETAPIPPHLPM